MSQIDFWKTNHSLDKVDVLFATPPCQGMSTANYKKKDDEQIRNSLVVEAIRIIGQIEPKIFVFENVRAFMKSICTDVSGKDMPIEQSIYSNLGERYHIFHKVINFKDYGIPSSRPRTIVIGTLKSLRNISPLNLFPVRQPEISLRTAIGDMEELSFGEKSKTDFLHFARPFPSYMIDWISDLKEGESAFNQSIEKRPYRIINGERVELKGSYMGNKYRRLFWDRPCACIATRNDQLASQDTIHPRDNRVLSPRELMKLMSIPDTFLWTKYDNLISPDNSDDYLRQNELNIRRCIGEAVPTGIIDSIARNILTLLDFQDFVDNFKESEIVEYEKSKSLMSNFYIFTFIREQQIENAKGKGAFYTPQSVVFDAVKLVPFMKGGSIRILEPSVGLGAFLPQIGSLFSDADEVIIDAVELEESTIADLQIALEKIDLGSNVKINFINSDFLEFEPTSKYDYIFTNPPYGKATKKYDFAQNSSSKLNNLFALFMLRFKDYANDIICIIPKNFAIAVEFFSLRKLYESFNVTRICDFGVKFFKKVFVEIISIHFTKAKHETTSVVDYINNVSFTHPQGYIFHDTLWLLYRNKWFDDFIKTLELDVFSSFRDRQITNPMLQAQGRYRILKSKNILDSGEIISIPGYDSFMDNISSLTVAKFLNSRAIIMPNFTYNLRATILPDGVIPNGSIAIMIPHKDVSNIDLSFFATPEYREYYAIVKSRSRFTLNIDNCSIHYIGIKK